MTTTQLITLMVALLGVLGGSGGLLTFLASRNQSAAARLREALADGDKARSNQRTLEDYANALRRQLEAADPPITPEEWPHYE